MEKRIFIILTFVVLTIYGCATPGKESFKLGLELARQDRLEEAIAMYEDALKKEPRISDYPKYLAAMRDAKSKLSMRHVQRAQAILKQMPLTYGQVKAAYQEVEKAEHLTPKDSNVLNLMSLIKSEMIT